jgi:predicted dehydrogenase
MLKEWDTLPVEFVAAHDPMAGNFPARVEQLKEKGVKFYDTYEEFLASDIECLWLPVPIDLHRSMTEKALAAGKKVLCEKPAAGCIQDVEGMIAARDAVKGQVAIGYQHLYAPSTHELKRRLVAGEIGAIKDASVVAAGRRADRYYARPWAAKLKRNGVWLLDSPANNAFAHYVHLVLFLLGPTQDTSAVPVEIEAELYRVNPIENYDTCCFRVTVETGQTIMIYITHACETNREPLLTVNGETGKMWVDSRKGVGAVVGGRTEEVKLSPIEHNDTLRAFARFMEDPSKPHASLEMSRMHSMVISGASECTPVVTVTEPVEKGFIEPTEINPGGNLLFIPGIVEVFEAAVREGKMLHETGKAGWTRAGGRMDLRGYKEFKGVP